MCFFITCTFVLLACNKDSSKKASSQADAAVVSVFGETLYNSDIAEMLPKGLGEKDSLVSVDIFVRKWINEQLVYQIAKKNISDKNQIDEMVENYRKTLITYTYQEDLLKENLSQKINEEELKKYYEENKAKLVLSSNLVKGVYLKVPVNAPQKDELLKWYKSTSDQAKEHVEKYSLRNAVAYEYFYDSWKNFAEIARFLPAGINDQGQFLQSHKSYEVRDSQYIYLLNIQEYKLAGSVPPFEYAKSQISDLVMNQRKEAFLRKFENDIYKKALDDKNIKFFKP
ncbi:MAG: hypothetical protein H6Q14_1725 [Bacteroidetes bacterium]|nr:hypothetical protein [Bacteroidota bacterium]